MPSIYKPKPTLVRQNDDYMCWAAVLSSWSWTLPYGEFNRMSQNEIRGKLQEMAPNRLKGEQARKGAIVIDDLRELLKDFGLRLFGLAARWDASPSATDIYTLFRDETDWPIFLGYQEKATRADFHANFVYGATSDGIVAVMEPRSGTITERSFEEFGAPFLIGLHHRGGG